MTYIGFWVISLAITIAVVGICGFDLDIKEKIGIIVCFQVVIALLEIGLYLMGAV